VRDTGYGIPPEAQERLFERFYRVDRSRSRAEGGTGLGLAIVKQLVELHRGHVMVESEVGVGSCFTVLIPDQTSDVAVTEEAGALPPQK
jgi:signal transduction histidine kinase